MDRKILAIGGAVIKTDLVDIKEIVRREMIEMLIHNGGSIFHDFQLATDKSIKSYESHSYPVDDLLESFECIRASSQLVWKWIRGGDGPKDSLTRMCQDRNIPVLLFTGLGCDFWHLFDNKWEDLAIKAKKDFDILAKRFLKPFHYILMGSAVIHPEVFLKALAISHPTKFRADAVDFLDMYRPKTRVAKYGKYYKMTHKEFTKKWLQGKIY